MDRKIIYIADRITKTVAESQVLNWIELYQQNDINFKLLIVLPIAVLFNSSEKSNMKKVLNENEIDYSYTYVLRTKDIPKFSRIFIIMKLMLLLFKDIIRKNRIIIQTRSDKYANSIRFIKKVYKNISLVYEVRGAIAEEFINSKNINDITEVKNEIIRNRYFSLINSQKKMFDIADTVFVVSWKLKEYIIEKISVDSNKIFVLPGAADKNLFYYNEILREETRRDLGIENREVIIYTGKLGIYWQIPDFLFTVIKKMIVKYNVFFLCITPDLKKANALKNQYKIADENILIKYSSFKEINSLLCASDYGIVLRKDIITNNVASPTKIPEYLLTGLPVIISKNIGDYSDYIQENNLGIVVDNNEEMILREYGNFHNRFIDRLEIQNIANKNYSKQAYLDRVFRIFNNLFGDEEVK